MEKFASRKNDADDEDAFVYAMQLASFSALPMTLKAALDLGLLQLISTAAVPLSSDELAARLGLLRTNPHAAAMIERILRLLASYSILSFSNSPDAEGRVISHYGTTLVCKYLTHGINGASMGAFSLMLQDKIPMESWYHIKEAVTKGTKPFEVAYGMNLYEYCRKDSKFNTVFNEGMKGHSSIVLKKVLDAYQGFRDSQIVVDVGGGLGFTLDMIISRHNHIKGINFDLPHVISHAPTIQGVEHIGGDMFQAIPSGDVIFIKCILCDWSDECCIKILENCRNALNPDGKVVIVDCILPKTPEPTCGAQVVFHLDMIMLAFCPGGQERTEEEFKALAKQSGFTKFKPFYINSNTHVIELSTK